MSGIEVIINARGGSFVENETEPLIIAEFAAAGLDANIRFARSGDDLESFTNEAVASGAEIIVGGGGDGTISSIAEKVYKANRTLGVLPLGTLNHFSKDLWLPQDMAGAVRVIAGGRTRKIDLGEVNGVIFVNNSSIGLYPHIVKQRELQQQRLGRGKWSAAFFSALKIIRRSPFFQVTLVIDEKEFIRTTPFLFVGNNEYKMEIYNIGRRETLDTGKLGVYFLHRSGRTGVLLLLLRTLLGRLRQAKDFEAVSTGEVTIQSRKETTLVAHDGEVKLLQTPLRYKSLPAALKVLVPSEGE